LGIGRREAKIFSPDMPVELAYSPSIVEKLLADNKKQI
jgi:hypothetical protein